MTGGRYAVTSGNCPDYIVHNDFNVYESGSTGLFALDSESEQKCIVLCSTLHTCVRYLMAEKQNHAEFLRPAEMTIT